MGAILPILQLRMTQKLFSKYFPKIKICRLFAIKRKRRSELIFAKLSEEDNLTAIVLT